MFFLCKPMEKEKRKFKKRKLMITWKSRKLLERKM